MEANITQAGLEIVGGQSQRVPGAARDAMIHEQLYRYAEDLQHLMEQHCTLEAHYERLRDSFGRIDERRETLEILLEHSRDVHIVTDAVGTILQSNSAVMSIAPVTRIVGYNLADWLLPSSREHFRTLLQQIVEGKQHAGVAWELRFRRDTADQASIIMSVQGFPVHKDGEIRHIHWIMRDITQLREQEFESQVSTMVFKHAAEGVMITDVEGEIIAVNPAFSRITGYGQEEVLGKRPSLLKSGVQDASFYASFWDALKSDGFWQGEVYNQKKNGEVFVEWLTVSAARDSDGRILSYIAVFSDLSRLLLAERRLSYLAHHDTLTGLANRLLLQDRLVQTLSQSRRTGVPFSVIFIDLDRFKQINDTLGHEIGDRVLQEAAVRVTRSVRDGDTVARLGGDEFVIIAVGLCGDTDISRFCEKIIDALMQPVHVEGRELFVGASLGCAEYPRHGDDETVLLKHADVAMYRAKSTGGNCFSIFEQILDVGDGPLRMETELRRVLERGQLRLEYQPQVAIEDGSLQGVEALLRWDHPKLGSVPPADFIPIAEQIGLIIPIGKWVLETACEQLAEWDAQGLPKVTMAINVSPRQLRDPEFVSTVTNAMAFNHIDPRRIELEVTEAEIMFHAEADFIKLGPLREMGVKIAIDDFGTGYASLARLMHLPIDRLKIDRAFVTPLEMDGDPRAGAICASIVAMGRALGLQMIAEGVESSLQRETLANQGCDFIQGYLTGRPMRPEAIPCWLAEQLVESVEKLAS